jgi:hypothetical protein
MLPTTCAYTFLLTYLPTTGTYYLPPMLGTYLPTHQLMVPTICAWYLPTNQPMLPLPPVLGTFLPTYQWYLSPVLGTFLSTYHLCLVPSFLPTYLPTYQLYLPTNHLLGYVADTERGREREREGWSSFLHTKKLSWLLLAILCTQLQPSAQVLLQQQELVCECMYAVAGSVAAAVAASAICYCCAVYCFS